MMIRKIFKESILFGINKVSVYKFAYFVKNTFLLIFVAMCFTSCVTNLRTGLFLKPQEQLTAGKTLLLFEPFIDSFNEDESILLRQSAIQAINTELASKGLVTEIYKNQNIGLSNELEWFMNNARKQVLDTAYLNNKVFTSSHIGQYCLVTFLRLKTSESPRGGSYGGSYRNFSMQIQILALNPKNQIMFYNEAYLPAMFSAQSATKELPEQIRELLSPFLIKLKRVK